MSLFFRRLKLYFKLYLSTWKKKDKKDTNETMRPEEGQNAERGQQDRPIGTSFFSI